MLDWLGDWGGMMDGLFMIAEIFITPFSAIALKAKLLTQFAKISKAPAD